MTTNTANSKIQQQPPQDKLVIFDDDPYFGALISATARNFGFAPNYFQSLYAMGNFARIKDYDIAIIDVYMDSIRGDELAEYLDMFVVQVPVVLVSGKDFNLEHQSAEWPSSVRAFIHKSEGPYQILATTRAVLQRDRLLKRLAAGGHPHGLGIVSDLDLASPGGIA